MSSYKKILTGAGKFRIELGLGRIQKMLELFNNPQNSTDFIHVAGTNGKGSVCAILEAALLQEGRKKIGKYTSPHLFDYAERFSINGENISEKELDELVLLVNQKDEAAGLNLSEFEILTTVCFLYFKKHKVDIGILETGLGGRFDATNIIEKPLVSIITSISFDHKERLGGTIEKIAFEKAGIIKPDCPAVFLRENAGYETLCRAAITCGAKIFDEDINVFPLGDNIVEINGKAYPFGLSGDFQAENLKLALLGLKAAGLLDIQSEAVKRAISGVRWKFRMEKINYKGKNLLVDSCHNPDGARVLAEHLEKYQKGKKIKFIFGCLANKEYKEILNTLYKKEYDFCFYEFCYPNALKYEQLGEFKTRLREIQNPLFEVEKGDFDLCVISGSIYMLGRVFNPAQ